MYRIRNPTLMTTFTHDELFIGEWHYYEADRSVEGHAPHGAPEKWGGRGGVLESLPALNDI